MTGETLRASVVGAGAWGTALAKVLAEAGHEVRLWSYEAEVAEAINARREHPYLPEIELPASLRAHAVGGAAAQGAPLVVSVRPSQGLRHAGCLGEVRKGRKL